MAAPDLHREVGDALGCAVAHARSVGGGDINVAMIATLTDGRRVFVKTNPSAPRSMFPAEARGLRWLDEARSLRVPRVLAVSETHGRGAAYLALELIEPATRAHDFDERLGRGLAALHGAGPGAFGLGHDNFIGSLAQANEASPTWAEFYRSRRLEPQLRLAAEHGRASRAMRRGFESLFAVLEERAGEPEPPARLHGDLWGGNLLVDERGEPCLIDPAVYGGHREMDLAMMRLFGGFGPRVFAAYEEARPLASDWRERVPLHQLYPLMVHVNLFGGGYVASVEQALSRLV